MFQCKKVYRHLFLMLAALLLTPMLLTAASAGTDDTTLQLSTNTINITTFYNGTTLTVNGTVAANNDLVLQVSGPRKDVHLKEKGKVAGFLWMNKTDVSLENTPAVYMAYTPAGNVENYLNAKTGIGYAALLKSINVTPESEDKAFIFGEYTKLMEHSGVYAIHQGAVTYGPEKNGQKEFHATLTIPPKMGVGQYTVQATGIKDGQVASQSQQELTVVLTGFPSLIASLAFGQPLIYGILAVFIAIATGLIIGVIFRGGGGAH